jgi:hypothetical protein
MKYVDCPLKLLVKQEEHLILDTKKHIHAIRNNSNAGYAKHILSTGQGHTYGAIMVAVDTVKTGKKGKQTPLRNITFIESVQITYTFTYTRHTFTLIKPHIQELTLTSNR